MVMQILRLLQNIFDWHLIAKALMDAVCAQNAAVPSL